MVKEFDILIKLVQSSEGRVLIFWFGLALVGATVTLEVFERSKL